MSKAKLVFDLIMKVSCNSMHYFTLPIFILFFFQHKELMEVGAQELAVTKLKQEMEKEKIEYVEEIKKSLLIENSATLQNELKRLEEKLTEDYRKEDAEKQIRFNNAIRTLEQDKERVIEDLKVRITVLTDDNDRIRKLLSKSSAESCEHIIQQMSKEIDTLKVC